MSKWSIKFVCQYFVMIETLDETIATYTDHIKIMSNRGLKSMHFAGKFQNIVFICCIKVLIEFI